MSCVHSWHLHPNQAGGGSGEVWHRRCAVQQHVLQANAGPGPPSAQHRGACTTNPFRLPPTSQMAATSNHHRSIISPARHTLRPPRCAPQRAVRAAHLEHGQPAVDELDQQAGDAEEESGDDHGQGAAVPDDAAGAHTHAGWRVDALKVAPGPARQEAGVAGVYAAASQMQERGVSAFAYLRRALIWWSAARNRDRGGCGAGSGGSAGGAAVDDCVPSSRPMSSVPGVCLDALEGSRRGTTPRKDDMAQSPRPLPCVATFRRTYYRCLQHWPCCQLVNVWLGGSILMRSEALSASLSCCC